MLTRTFKDGTPLSIIGFGGIIVADETQFDADHYVAEAVDAGVNYFDVSPTYSDAEYRLGPALSGKRKEVFLACKTDYRSQKGRVPELEQELHESLRRLETDYFDLYQMHAMSTMREVEEVTGPKGALEIFLKAKKEGIIRNIGFSAHNEDVAVALLEAYPFDSMLLPINWVNIFNGDFGLRAIQKAREKGTSILAIKAMAKTVHTGGEKKYPKAWYEPIDDDKLASLALRFTLSQPIVSAIPPGDIDHFRLAIKTAEKFKPVTEAEINSLKEQARGLKPIFSSK